MLYTPIFPLVIIKYITVTFVIYELKPQKQFTMLQL